MQQKDVTINETLSLTQLDSILVDFKTEWQAVFFHLIAFYAIPLVTNHNPLAVIKEWLILTTGSEPLDPADAPHRSGVRPICVSVKATREWGLLLLLLAFGLQQLSVKGGSVLESLLSVCEVPLSESCCSLIAPLLLQLVRVGLPLFHLTLDSCSPSLLRLG